MQKLDCRKQIHYNNRDNKPQSYREETMAINFNSGGTFNLKPIPVNMVRDEVYGMLIDGEVCMMAFQTVRDQLVFTNKRIISIDVQGITGKRKSYASMPYSKIQYFAVQTPGFGAVPDVQQRDDRHL